MANRNATARAIHDTVIRHIQNRYQNRGFSVTINPGSYRNADWNGEYVDVIVEQRNTNNTILMEVETEDSVSQSEATGQWISYSQSFESWYLAVPSSHRDRARALLEEHGINNCTLIEWENFGGSVSASNLPVID